MESYIQKCLDLLESYEKNVLVFLSNFFDEDEIERLVKKIPQNNTKYLSENDHPSYKAIIGLSMIRALKDEVKVCLGSGNISSEYAAQLIQRSLVAGFYVSSPLADYSEFALGLLEEAQPRIYSKRATDARYQTPRKLLSQAAKVARQLWESESTLKHHEMKKYLIEEYQDETGIHPFLQLSEKSLLETVKRVAKEMNRPGLISGQRKSK